MSATALEPETGDFVSVLDRIVGPIGGLATAIVAICGLVDGSPVLAVVATIVFGAVLLVRQAARFYRSSASGADPFARNSMLVLLLVSAAGLGLGLSAFLGVDPAALAPAASIAFAVVLALSGNARWRMHAVDDRRPRAREFLWSEIEFDATVEALAGLAATALAAIALAGHRNDVTLNLGALLVLGSTLILTGRASTILAHGLAKTLRG